MRDDLLKQLREKASKQDVAAITVLHNAVVNNMATYNEAPTAANLKSWQAAQDAYDAALGEMAEKYGLAAPPAADFANLRLVHAWLKENGWKISLSGIYKHKNEGKITPDKSGAYSLARVRKYAETWLKRADTGSRVKDELERFQRRKAIAETRRAEAQAKKLEHELAVAEGRYIPRDDFYTELAARALALESGLKAMVQRRAAGWIEMVGGDPSRARDLLAAVSADIDTALSEYATMDRFVVIVDNQPRQEASG